MDVPSGNLQSRKNLIMAMAAAVLIALAAAILFQPLDISIFASALSLHDLKLPLYQTTRRETTLLITSFILVPLSLAIYRGAFSSRGGAKYFLIFQIFVLSYFCQWLVWTVFKLPTSPLLIICGLSVSFVCGLVEGHKQTLREEQVKNKLIIALKEKELKEAHLQLVKQDEADRRILASDLHDQVLNDLKTLRQSVQALKGSDQNDATAIIEHDKKIAEIDAMLDQTSTQIREVMENLTPSVLENLGLASAIDDLLRRAAVRGKFKARLKNDSGKIISSISKIEELLLFRIVQEAISNTVKHSGASRVEITIAEDQDFFTISILDDGRGFQSDNERGASRGLRYMRQRADLLGAHINWVQGRDNKGCLVQVKGNFKEGKK